jgi:hypothetical protein
VGRSGHAQKRVKTLHMSHVMRSKKNIKSVIDAAIRRSVALHPSRSF